MTYKAKILELLLDKRWHHIIAISQYACPGSIGMAVAQQISKLRKEGHEIETRLVTGSGGSTMAEYRLTRSREEVSLNVLPLV